MRNSSVYDKLEGNKSMISGAPSIKIKKTVSFETIKNICHDIKKHFKKYGRNS